jgi:transcription antitermination protein NusB
MAFQQQKLREIVFQILYSFDIGKADENDMITLLMKELEVSRKTVRIALEKVRQLQEKQSEIDEMIGKASLSYNFERIQTIEKNVLRLGAYEMIFDDSIPPKVAIAEAIRLARKFGTPESASFVNAIMDNLYKASQGEDVDGSHLSKTIEELHKSEEIANEAANTMKKDEEDEE